MVKELLKSNGGLLTVNTVFGSWLHIAASYGRIDIASYLIDCGIDVNRNGDISGGNPIRSAAENGQIEMVEFLYNHGTEFDVSEAAKILYLEQSMEGIIMSFNFWLNMELTLQKSYPIGELDHVDGCVYAQQIGRHKIEQYLREKNDLK